MTTDTPERVLAEAFQEDCQTQWAKRPHAPDFLTALHATRRTPWSCTRSHGAEASALLAASPTLAAALTRGLAVSGDVEALREALERERNALDALHREADHPKGICWIDHQTWPCKTVAVLTCARAENDAKLAAVRAETLAGSGVVEALRFLSTYEKDPPEVMYDEWAYNRLLAFVHDVATRALAATPPTPALTAAREVPSAEQLLAALQDAVRGKWGQTDPEIAESMHRYLAALAAPAPETYNTHKDGCPGRYHVRDSAYCDLCNPGWRSTEWGKAYSGPCYPPTPALPAARLAETVEELRPNCGKLRSVHGPLMGLGYAAALDDILAALATPAPEVER